ncbi:MAG: T9SS type A sorting domain-containing protein [Prolixibacteraceae bacterium]
MRKYILTVLATAFFLTTSLAQQLAFPSAEGYGKYTVGGRGGKVIEVTNLNASGTGSFAAAIGASGPRTVVFRVSGTITGNFNIKNDNITIAGQTAPGDGICIRGNLSTSADDVIIRYIRVRYDPSMGENDGIGGRYQKNIIFDHISASWSTDETMTLYHNENTTVQWCILAEACPKGTTDEHRFGGIWGNNYGTWHHNLIAHNASRNPRWASGCGYNDYRNNVIYNWEYASCYGGEAHQVGDRRTPPIEHSTINMVANYYKPGPATESGVRNRIADPSTRDGDADAGQWWISDNFVDGSSSVTADNWKGVTKTGSAYRLKEPWTAMEIDQQTAEEAYRTVLEYSGCSLPTRDKVDADIIDDVLKGTGKYGKNGIIDRPSDVGGWPTLNSTTAPDDSDHDGMPDHWETAKGLNSTDPEDRNTIGESGYTNLEIYLNSLVNNPSLFFAPKNVNAELIDVTMVEITWEDTNDNETGFRIERSKGETGAFENIAEVQEGATSYIDNALEELTEYHYRVVAFNDSLTSSYEKIVNISTLSSTSMPEVVSNPSPENHAINIAADPTLTWETSINIDGYDVYFGTENPPPFIVNQTETTFKPGELKEGETFFWRIDSKNKNGTIEGEIWSFTVEGKLSSVKKTKVNEFMPITNYPNPFNINTTIYYEIKSNSEVKLSVYDVLGKHLATLVNQQETAGKHTILFDAGNLESGVYFLNLQAGLQEKIAKMTLIK